jgi:hypothetical protein
MPRRPRTTPLQQCDKLAASRGFIMQLHQMVRFGDEPGEGSPRQHRKGAPCRSRGAIQIGCDEGRVLWLVTAETARDQVQQCLLALLGYRSIRSHNFHKHDKNLAGASWWSEVNKHNVWQQLCRIQRDLQRMFQRRIAKWPLARAVAVADPGDKWIAEKSWSKHLNNGLHDSLTWTWREYYRRAGWKVDRYVAARRDCTGAGRSSTRGAAAAT